MSFDLVHHEYIGVPDKSQSLWNRAMSFDVSLRLNTGGKNTCLNPFGTGQCLSTRHEVKERLQKRLNPFGTGQCLSTAVGC